MKKILIIIFILLLLAPVYSKGVKFEWKFITGRSFTMDKYTRQTVIKNGRTVRERMIKDYIVIIPVKKRGDYFHLKGKYYSYSKDLSKKSVFHLDSAYDLDFNMTGQGLYQVPKKMIMPSIRNIPLFPREEIEPGHMWKADGIEVIEFKPPVTLSVDVSYQFVGFEKRGNKNLAKIVFNYLWNHIVEVEHQDVPYKYIGSSFSTLWYDRETLLPVYIENLYDLGMIYKNGEVMQYKGDLKGYYNLKGTVKENKGVQNEIYEKLKRSDRDINVRKDKNNVIIEFDDIYFKFDDAQLTKVAKDKLENIGKILKNYKNCRILTKGHTDNTGSSKYNKDLSDRRARSVLKFLKENEYIDPDHSSYEGVGDLEPRYDNRTKEGRKKNRRVEIIITPE